MAKNANTDTTKQDLESTGRLHDGYAYVVTTKDAGALRFHDYDAFAVVRARWLDARKDPANGLLSFSGARRATTFDEGDRVIQEIGKIEGRGDVLGAQVIAIRYASDRDDHADSALEAARTLLEIQGAAAQELVSQGALEEDTEDTVATIPPAVTDDTGLDEGFHSS